MSLAFFMGTRPEITKFDSLLKEAILRSLDFKIIHTGQHYDWEMSMQYIEDLNLPEPDVFLSEEKGDSTANVGRIYRDTAKYLQKNTPKAAIVLGDTNSTLGVSLAACKLGIPLVHIEAGCRSFDWDMPEEKNRVIVSDCADLHFAPTELTVRNLKSENVRGEVILSGHPIVKTVNTQIKYVGEYGIPRGPYFLVTFHRVENVDYKPQLHRIIQALKSIDSKIIFPVHPRTRRRLEEFGLIDEIKTIESLVITPPLPYSETLGLIANASVVVTDSGGLQQEAYILGTPCITVRKSIPWRELAEVGVTIHLDPTKSGFVEFFETVDTAHQTVKAKLLNAGKIFGDDNVPKEITDVLCSTYEM